MKVGDGPGDWPFWAETSERALLLDTRSDWVPSWIFKYGIFFVYLLKIK